MALGDDVKLPVLQPGWSFACESGCGECKPVATQIEYSRTTTPEGILLESKEYRGFVSSCCKSDLFIFDDADGDEVDWDYAVSQGVQDV